MCHARMETAEYIWRNWCLLDRILLQNCINTYTLHIVGELESIAREGKIYINLHLFQDLAAQHGKEGFIYTKQNWEWSLASLWINTLLGPTRLKVKFRLKLSNHVERKMTEKWSGNEWEKN